MTKVSSKYSPKAAVSSKASGAKPSVPTASKRSKAPSARPTAGLVGMKKHHASIARTMDLPQYDLSTMDNAILLSGAPCHAHQQMEYALNKHKPVNVFDLQKTMAQAQMSASGRVRLEGGMAYCTLTKRTLMGRTTEAPVELIDICSGGKVAGVIPKDGSWWTTDVQGKLLRQVKPTHIPIDV